MDYKNCAPQLLATTNTPHKEVLLNLNPSSEGFIGQAAMRAGYWKLILLARPSVM